MARQTTTDDANKTYFQKHKTAIITGTVIGAVALAAIFLYMKYGKKGIKAPTASRLRYYYF